MKSLPVPARPPGEARKLGMLLDASALRGLNREERDAVARVRRSKTGHRSRGLRRDCVAHVELHPHAFLPFGR